jgi:hypothetical protein
MAIVTLAWSLKAWFALTIPVAPRWRTQHTADRERVLRMEFRSLCARPSLAEEEAHVAKAKTSDCNPG